MTQLKSWLRSTTGILVLSTGLSLLLLAETIFAPWGPYFPLFAILAMVIPLLLKTYEFGRFRKVMASAWLLTLGIFLLNLILDLGIFGWLYERVLDSLGVAGDPFYSVDAAVDVMFEAVVRNLGISLDTAQGLFALFTLVWAPFGEELFYRGYMYGGLRKAHGFWTAALIPAFFFGIRHAFHFFYMWPDVPWVAAGMWFASTAAYAIYISYLYERSGSLYPPIVEHVMINIVWLLMTL
ncbi:MAG: CPBP family intramembrane glutamic endopeptidase [Anaerolineales bacterium]